MPCLMMDLDDKNTDSYVWLKHKNQLMTWIFQTLEPNILQVRPVASIETRTKIKLELSA